MVESVKLSIVMPCYNVADTFDRAIDSVLAQAANFTYEIIIVDDCSDDGGPALFRHYKEKYAFIRVIRHETNMGNAMSFYDGLNAAQGEYFCVLDGDDYYTVRDKLQKQVDFLDNDVDREYVAVTHYFVIDLGDGMVNLPNQNFITEYNYIDFLAQKAGYYHTTTYMYRNIFKGNIPEQFKMEAFRGDTPRTAFHLMYSNRKVKVLNFVGSAYVFNRYGIWSALNEKQQFKRQIQLWSDLREYVRSEKEYSFYDKLIDIWTKKLHSATDTHREYPSISIDACLGRLRKFASAYAFSKEAREFVFNGIYCSEFIDSACATLGYVYRIYNNKFVQSEVNNSNICIFISRFNPQGGGIFQEILEITKIYHDRQVHIIASTPGKKDNLAVEFLEKYPNAHLHVIPEDCGSRIEALSDLYKEILPVKAYYYSTHNGTYIQALMQVGPCNNVTLFSFDHGFICGITNPSVDCIVAKRPSDFEMLRKKFGEKVIYIPTWNDKPELPDGLYYRAFGNHDRLFTASSAARFYKVDGKNPFIYLDMVLQLLEHTRGRHYHFGPIPEEKLEYVKNFLREHALSEDSFVHIPWAENLAVTVLQNNIDVFIEPFPTVSYKLTLSMFSCGVPVFIHDSVQRLSKVDFVYSRCLSWKTDEEFYSVLAGLDRETLEEHSRLARAYFSETHSIDNVGPFFVAEQSFPFPLPVNVTDNIVHEIREYLNLYSNDMNAKLVKVMQPAQKAQTAKRPRAEKPKPSRPWIVLKYRSMFQCYKVHGLRYTVRRIGAHIFGKHGGQKVGLWQGLKNFLMVFLPPPTKTFHREIARLKYDNRKLSKYNTRLVSELMESGFGETNLSLKALDKKLNRLSEDQRIAREMLASDQQDLRKTIKALDEKLNRLGEDQRTAREMLASDQQDLRKTIQQQVETVRDTWRYTNEAVWANVYNSTVVSSHWLKDKTISPGRWAVGYPCLYALYRVLDEFQPMKILELGMGQTTRVISQYAAANSDVRHIVVEHDAEWVSYFTKNVPLPNNTEVMMLPTETVSYKGADGVLVFKGIMLELSGETFDFICIDAPFGTQPVKGQKTMSRIDVLRMLPGCLESSFVILLDDTGREGEKATVAEMDEVLSAAGIDFKIGSYSGAKEARLWCSADYAFFSSM